MPQATTIVKSYDLEERTFRFANNVRLLLAKTSNSMVNLEDVDQLIRSSGSVAANYIEANEAVSKKDFLYRIRVCRKEAKESRLWLRLLPAHAMIELETLRTQLVDEAWQLERIFGAILHKSLPS